MLVIVQCSSVTKKGCKQGKKLLKKESIVGIQNIETRTGFTKQ